MVQTPIPESLWDRLTTFVRGPLVLTVWRLLLLVVFGALIVGLATAGGLAGLIGGVVVFVFIAPIVRDSARDVWNANFQEVSIRDR